MENLNVMVIGNRLHEFANNKNILIFDQFSHLLSIESKLLNSQNNYLVTIGQGLNSQQINDIKEKIEQLNLSHRFHLAGELAHAIRASSELTHKLKSENSMISEPHRLSASTFKSYLLLDEACAEMSDHITGQHIQGMVLLEASRQMVNSVAEKYLISDKNTARKGFVLNSINSTFFEYVFPLEVELIFTLDNIRNGLNNDFKAEASISVYQHEEIMLEINVIFSVMDKKTLLNIESKMAETSVQKALLQNQLYITYPQQVA